MMLRYSLALVLCFVAACDGADGPPDPLPSGPSVQGDAVRVPDPVVLEGEGPWHVHASADVRVFDKPVVECHFVGEPGLTYHLTAEAEGFVPLIYASPMDHDLGEIHESDSGVIVFTCDDSRRRWALLVTRPPLSENEQIRLRLGVRE